MLFRSLMSICGAPGGTPTKYGVAIVDVCTGMLACNSILAALNARHRTGRGQRVDVSLYETSLAMLVNVASSYLACGKEAGRFGNGHPSIVPYTTYATSDGMLALAVGNDSQFAKCATVLGHPEWASDPRFAKNRDRVVNRALVDAMVGEALAREPANTWIEKLQAAGVPCGKINTVAQAFADPHTAARRMTETVTHPTIGDLTMLGIPFKFGDTPTAMRYPPPMLGQHTKEILNQHLGMDDESIHMLREQNVI